jgi:hypothetical protein
MFIPAYRRTVRVETAFSMLHDLNFICELDKAHEVEKGKVLLSVVEVLASGRTVTQEEAQRALDAVDRIHAQGFELVPSWRTSCFIDRIRNGAVRQAMDQGCDLLFMLDSDVFAPYGASPILRSLLSTMSQTGAAVVGGVYMHRAGEKMLVHPAKVNEIYECDFVATGMMLIDLAAIAKLEWPLFKVELTEDGTDVACGEDIYFCRKAKAAGLKVVADYTIANGHGTEDAIYTLPVEIQKRIADAAALPTAEVTNAA